MKYSESHEWVDVQNGLGKVGISEHAQKELGEIVYVELPEVGKTVKAGQEAAVLESTKAAADVYSPVSGKIVEVNQALAENSGLVNQFPESDGWIFKVELADPGELGALMDPEKYFAKLK